METFTSPTDSILHEKCSQKFLRKTFGIEAEDLHVLHPETRARICTLLAEWHSIQRESGTAHICWAEEQMNLIHEKLCEALECAGILHTKK